MLMCSRLRAWRAPLLRLGRSTYRPRQPYAARPPPTLLMLLLPQCCGIETIYELSCCRARSTRRERTTTSTSSHFGTTHPPRNKVGAELAVAAALCPSTASWNNPTPLVRAILQLLLSSLCALAVVRLCRYDTAPARGAGQAWKMLGD